MKLVNGGLALILLLTLVGPLPTARADNTPARKTLTIASTYPDKLGCPATWQPDCSKTFLADDPGAGTFSVPGRTTAIFLAMNRAPAASAATVVVTLGATQAAQTVAATSAIVTAATSAPVAVDTTSTGLAVALIWIAIAVAVAVTVFLVWRTRPRS